MAELLFNILSTSKCSFLQFRQSIEVVMLQRSCAFNWKSGRRNQTSQGDHSDHVSSPSGTMTIQSHPRGRCSPGLSWQVEELWKAACLPGTFSLEYRCFNTFMETHGFSMVEPQLKTNMVRNHTRNGIPPQHCLGYEN